MAAAAHTWVLTGGMGAIGLLLFSAINARYLDQDTKKWRFLATTSMTLAMFTEIMTLNLPSLFFPLASLATVGKNIAFILWTSTSARDHLKLALRDN